MSGIEDEAVTAASGACAGPVVVDIKVEQCVTETLDTYEVITRGLDFVKKKLASVHLQHVSTGSNVCSSIPRLVAVSKTKPVQLVLHAYQRGQRHFGENYVQELVEKSQHPLLANLEDICWHFIGHLQRNKCNSLVACPNLWAVETVDSERLANGLDTGWSKKGSGKLNIFVQVNTSAENSKHGTNSSDEAVSLVQHIIKCCANLKFIGLMTIGKSGHDYTTGPNPDFMYLIDLRRRVCSELGLNCDEVELSMGMSADFEEATLAGSTSVRVGSVIFGVRQTKNAT